MKIRKVLFNELPPFQKGNLVEFTLPAKKQSGLAEIHLITGPNGTGKTRFLSFLEGGFGNNRDLTNRGVTPSSKLGVIGISTDKGDKNWTWSKFISSIHILNSDSIRNYDELVKSGSSGYLTHVGGFGLSFRGSLRVEDTEIQSQAPVNLGNINEHISFDLRPNQESRQIAQAIANIVSMGSQEIAQNVKGEKYGTLLNCVNEVLGEVLGSKTAFFVDSRGEKLTLNVLIDSERIPLSHLPDGLRSIIAWLFATIAKLETTFPEEENPLSHPFTMILDEPETHLHPAWQRHILRIAQKLFPNAQFFVATHSPFIISSVNYGTIHLLRKNSKGFVEFYDQIPCSEGDTYMDVVEDVLGISERYDPETESLLNDFRKLREEVFANEFKREAELRDLMIKIGGRSESLQHMMGRELFQLNKAMAAVAVA